MACLAKLVILSFCVLNVSSFENILLGDLPEDILAEFIQIALKGILDAEPECTSPPGTDKVKLLLYNRTIPDNPIALDPSNPYQIDPSKPLKVLIHGWLANATDYGFPGLKNAYLKRYDCNVVIIDWSKLSRQLYPISCCALNGIGRLVATLLCNFSDQTKVALSSVHLVGHSLGAHLSGFVGDHTKQICKQNIGRITGLDPAGPFFQNNDKSKRLDPSDADFVDAIQTNEGFFGYFGGACGHVNFHVNCGTLQPGTLIPSCVEDLYNLTTIIVAGNHLRALDLMIESINSDEFKGKSCTNCPVMPLFCPVDFINWSFVTMGENCEKNPSNVNYLVPTNDKPKFAQGCAPFPLQGCE